MPELRCPECGKELLPPKPGAGGKYCICTACGREVYASKKVKINVKCPKCGAENEATVAL